MGTTKKLIAACIVAGLTFAAAQTTTKKDHKPAKAEQKAAAEQGPPGPSVEAKRLTQSFLGTYKVTGKIDDQSWAPGGAQGSGTETVRGGPGGYSIISDAKMNFGKMGEMTGHGVMWWDPDKKAYFGLWCDNWAPKCEGTGAGHWDSDKLVFVGDSLMNGQSIKMRQTYSNISSKGHDWKLETGDGKGGWKPAMSLRYDRMSK